MGVAFADSFDVGFFTGTPLSTDVPNLYPCALDSHPFLISESGKYPRDRSSIPITRANLTGSNELGENTLNPDSGWRRSQSSWHRGAGQTRLDAEDSTRERFRSSKGIDPWTRWQLSLLNTTSRVRVSASTNLFLARAGTRLYLADGQDVYHSTDLSVWTSADIQAGEPGTTVKAITSDGTRVFAALGANGIHVTDSGAITSVHYSNVDADCLEWLKSRLFAGDGNVLYEIVTAGLPAAPTPLFTHPSPGFQWVGFCDGQANVYAAGYSGDKSQVYRIGIKSDGSGLSAPVVAGELPDGEIVTGIGSYLGYVFIGSNLGVRIALPSSDGSLQVGALVRTTTNVTCFEGQDQFMWFGWTNYDSTSTGLGRMSLAFLNEDVPAYASDLMASAQGAIQGVVTLNDQRVFTVAGAGVYQEGTSKVTSGVLETGRAAWDVGEPKIALSVQARHSSFVGTHGIEISVDSGAYTSLGTIAQNEAVSARQVLGESFELRHTLTASGGVGPVVTRWTLLALPAPPMVRQITVPLQIRAEDTTLRNTRRQRDVAGEVAFLESLRDSRKVFTYQERGQSFSVTMTDCKWYPEDRAPDDGADQGVFVAVMTTVGA